VRVRLTIVALVSVLAAASGARARSLDRFQFVVDTATGKTAATSSPSGAVEAPPATPATADARLAPAPRTPRGTGLRNDGGAAVLRDGKGGVRLRVPMGTSTRDWSQWAVVQGDRVVFAWREEESRDNRDSWNAVDIPSGKRIWQRRIPIWMQSEATGLDGRAIVVDTAKQVEIVDGKTGKTLRALSKGERWFSMTELPGGLLVEAGSHLHLVDRTTRADRWRLDKHGRLISWTPLPEADRALMQTDAATAVIDTRDGKIVWQRAAASYSELWAVGDRIYEPNLERRSHEDAIVSVTERRLEDGAKIATHQVQRYQRFFDSSRVTIVGARDGKVDVVTTWIVLD
jgi:hypothetical protein